MFSSNPYSTFSSYSKASIPNFEAGARPLGGASGVQGVAGKQLGPSPAWRACSLRPHPFGRQLLPRVHTIRAQNEWDLILGTVSSLSADFSRTDLV